MKPSIVKLSGLLGKKEWFCSKLTFVDFILGDFFQAFSLFNENFATEFPELKAHQERLWQLEGVSDYIKSGRFKERPVNYYPFAKWFWSAKYYLSQ